MLFENRKIKIKYIEEYIDDYSNRSFLFTIDIKDFDTPILNLVYDVKESIISKTYLDKQFENIPKSHIVYKMFSLIWNNWNYKIYDKSYIDCIYFNNN